VQARMCARIW